MKSLVYIETVKKAKLVLFLTFFVINFALIFICLTIG